LLRDRITADAGARRNIFRSMRVQDASAGRIEFQPMIGTLNAIAVDDLAHMQGCESVRTAILQCGDISIRFSEKNDRLFQNRAAEQLAVGEIIGPGGDIPRVAEVAPADHFLFAVEKLELHCARHAGPPYLRPIKQRLDLRNGEAACLRECRGLSFGPSLRGKPPSRARRTPQSRSTPFALDGGGRERLVHIDGNQTARRTIILWRSRKAPLPPKSQRER